MNTDKPNGAAPTPARKSIANLPGDDALKLAIDEGMRRMEDIIQGQTAGLTESQFRDAFE